MRRSLGEGLRLAGRPHSFAFSNPLKGQIKRTLLFTKNYTLYSPAKGPFRQPPGFGRITTFGASEGRVQCACSRSIPSSAEPFPMEKPKNSPPGKHQMILSPDREAAGPLLVF